MAEGVSYEHVHTKVTESMPNRRLDHMCISVGCDGLQGTVGVRPITGSGMYSEVAYTAFDMAREVGLKILHRLVMEIVRMRTEGNEYRATIYVEDVARASRQLGINTIDMDDAGNLPGCVAPETIARTSKKERRPGSIGEAQGCKTEGR